MIIFLDFDGVLHPISSRIVRQEGGAIVIDQAPDGEPIFCRVPLLAAVLRDFPEVRIVLSSSWTRYVPKAALLEPLQDLADRVIGSLSPYERGTRYERVRTFLEPFEGEPWIAIEDDRRNFPDAVPVLWTDSSTGLTIKDLALLRMRLSEAKTELYSQTDRKKERGG